MVSPHVVLIGPPGAGKSTVGAVLARRLQVDLVDTDVLIESRAGTSIAEIFVDQGEAAFRAFEREVVAEVLRSHDGIVALGGGSILDEHTRAELCDHRVAFLEVSLHDAANRAGFNQGRPLLALNPRAKWKSLMDARRPIYQGLATISVDTDGRTPDDVATDIVALLGLGEPAAQEEIGHA